MAAHTSNLLHYSKVGLLVCVCIFCSLLFISPPLSLRAYMYFSLSFWLNTYVRAGWVVPCLVEAYVGKDDHDYDLMLAPPNYKSHYAVFLHP
jgi:hypothetical protein